MRRVAIIPLVIASITATLNGSAEAETLVAGDALATEVIWPLEEQAQIAPNTAISTALLHALAAPP